MFDQFLGDVPTPLKFLLAFVVVILLIVVAAWLIRRFGGQRFGPSSGAGRSRQPRLGVLDVLAIDGRRRLVIVRRDNVEHLVMIGGPNDVVVESGILRQPAGMQAARDAPPLGQAEPQPSRAAPPQPTPETRTPPPPVAADAPRGQPKIAEAPSVAAPAGQSPAQTSQQPAIRPAASAPTPAPQIQPAAVRPAAPPPPVRQVPPAEPQLRPEAPRTEAARPEAPKIEAPRSETPKVEAPRVETPRIDVARPASPAPAAAAPERPVAPPAPQAAPAPAAPRPVPQQIIAGSAAARSVEPADQANELADRLAAALKRPVSPAARPAPEKPATPADELPRQMPPMGAAPADAPKPAVPEVKPDTRSGEGPGPADDDLLASLEADMANLLGRDVGKGK